jgi:hypothetical protein
MPLRLLTAAATSLVLMLTLVACGYVPAVGDSVHGVLFVTAPISPTPTPGIPMQTTETDANRLAVYDVRQSIRSESPSGLMPEDRKRVVVAMRLVNTGTETVEFRPISFSMVDESGEIAPLTFAGLAFAGLAKTDATFRPGEMVYGRVGFIVRRDATRVTLRYGDGRAGQQPLQISLDLRGLPWHEPVLGPR